MRPSDNSTHILLSSNRTDLAEVFIPSPFDNCCVLLNNFGQFAQGSSIKAIAVRQMNCRMQPEFSFAFAAASMHMHWFARAVFVRLEEEPKSFIAKYDWHSVPYASVPFPAVRRNR